MVQITSIGLRCELHHQHQTLGQTVKHRRIKRLLTVPFETVEPWGVEASLEQKLSKYYASCFKNLQHANIILDCTHHLINLRNYENETA